MGSPDPDIDEDLRVTHAPPATLSPADLVRRSEITVLLRTLTHELTHEQRQRVARIRASFKDAGDYIEFLGTRTEHAWVVGHLRKVDGRLCLFRLGTRRVFEVLAEAAPAMPADGRLWFGRTRTNRFNEAEGPVDLLERVDDGDL